MMVERFLNSNPVNSLEPVCTREDICLMKEEIKQIFIHPSLINYIVELADYTREAFDVSIGVSPRGIISMVSAVRAYSYIEGRGYVVPEDIAILAPYVWSHRIVLQSGYANKDNREQIIANALSNVSVPTEEWDK